MTPGVIHRRSVLMDLATGSVRVEDRVEGEGRHSFLASLHLAPGWSVIPANDGWTAHGPDGASSLRFRWIRPPERCRMRVEDDLHSPSYGVIRKASTVRVEWAGDAPVRVRYELVTAGADSCRSGAPS